MPLRPSSPPSVLWALSFAFAMSVIIYGVVGFYLRGQMAPPEDTESLATALMAAALCAGLLASLLITAGTPLAVARIGHWQAWHIARLAFAEVPAVLGFAGFYMGGSQLGFLATLLWSLGLMALCLPTDRDREAWDERAREHARKPGIRTGR